MGKHSVNRRSEIIRHTIRLEGGYSDDPADSGGKTRYGVTEAVARGFGYLGPMSELPMATAVAIYIVRYWVPINGDKLLDLSESIAREVFDTAVNMGPGRAARFLQRALDVLTNDTVVVDGDIGPKTIEALTRYLDTRQEAVLLIAINCLQGKYYIELAERREKDKRFVYGWLKNRVIM